MAKGIRVLSLAVAVLSVLFMAAPQAGASITIDVFASSAPNGSGSASFPGYAANAIYAIENGLSTYGGSRSTTPTAYARAGSTINAGDIAVTSFNSWRGEVNPSAPFQNEYGNRLHFGVHILGNGEQFSISQLSFVMGSSDATNSLACSFLGGYDYSSNYVGINYGADGIKGTADDFRITSGASTQMVDELVGRGSGNAWWPGGDDVTPGNPAGGAQAAMDNYVAWVASQDNLTVTGTYTLAALKGGVAASGSDSVAVTVPEPSALLFLGMAVVGLAGMRRRFIK